MGTNSYVFQVPTFYGKSGNNHRRIGRQETASTESSNGVGFGSLDKSSLASGHGGSLTGVIPPKKRGRSIAVFKKWISLEVVVPKNQWKSACRPIKLTMKPIFLSWRYDEWILFETTTSDRWFQNVQSRHQKKILLFLKNSILLEEIRRENRLLSTKPYQNVGIFEPYQRLWELAGFLVAINGHVSYWIKPPPRIW